MNTKTMRKAARDLVPGDIMCGQVVLNARTTGSGRIELTLATLGGAADCGVQTYAPDSQFMVELPAGLTPVQAKADELLGYARKYWDGYLNPQDNANLRVLLDELDPPKPPTLEEAINVLRNLTRNVLSAGPCATPCSLVADAERLLARVPS